MSEQEQIKALVEALNSIIKQEIFCDGLVADLHDMNIKTLADAYMQGHLDTCQQIKEALAEALTQEDQDLAD